MCSNDYPTIQSVQYTTSRVTSLGKSTLDLPVPLCFIRRMNFISKPLIPLLFAAACIGLCPGRGAVREPARVIELWPSLPPGDKGVTGAEQDTTKSDGRM